MEERRGEERSEGKRVRGGEGEGRREGENVKGLINTQMLPTWV